MLTLRDYQQKAIDSIYTYFATKQGNPLIVIPTGGGKSLVMAKFLHGVLSKYPEQRVLMLAHRKELLQQNKEELLDVWSEAPVGIYSAGLNKKEFDKPITIGGIQSYSRIQDKNLRFYDLVLIDECHLVPNESQGQYRKTIERLKEINPKMKIIGFTATPFRLQDGLLIEGDNRIFTDISYNVPISYLINHGYLTPFRSKITREIDLSKVKMQQGDYKISDLEKEYTELDLIKETVEKIIDYGQDRKSWIIFCVSVKHVEMVSEQLTERGITCKYITGKTNSEERQNIIDQFKSRAIRAIVNCDVLTTGFNAKNIDMLIMLRPTKSTALYVQLLGRGSRLYPGKEDCLVLDFANNLQEHGEIEKIELKNLRGKPQLKKEKITIKPCPECEAPNHISRIYCIECDYQIREKVEREFTHKSDITNVTIDGKLQNWLPVNNIIYKHHKSPEGNLSIKAIYDCKLQTIYKFLFPHKDNYARTLTQQWWNIHMEATLQYDLSNKKIDSLPRYIGEAEELKRSMPHNLGDFINHAIGFAKPTAINVEKEGKFYKIIDYRF